MATINHTEGLSYDFSEPVVFTVVAEDETAKEWTVNVTYGYSPFGTDCIKRVDNCLYGFRYYPIFKKIGGGTIQWKNIYGSRW